MAGFRRDRPSPRAWLAWAVTLLVALLGFALLPGGAVASDLHAAPSLGPAEAMLWMGHRRTGPWSLGVGVRSSAEPMHVWAMRPAAAAPTGDGLRIGVGWSPSSAARLSVETDAGRLWGASPVAAGEAASPLAFRRVDPYANLRAGSLLKMELDNGVKVALRPRGRAIAVQFSRQW